MDASILIRTRNEAHFIGKTLRKVEQQVFSGDHEVIVVDSGSTDATVAIVKDYGVKLIEIEQQRFSYGRALNMGASHAKGRFIVNLSAHAIPHDDKWLRSLVDGFESDNVAGVYGRQLSLPRMNPFESFQNEIFFGPERAVFDNKNGGKVGDVHFSNANSAVRRDLWKRFRFNEEVAYAEDVFWQRELMEKGFSIVYSPEAVVQHIHPVSIKKAYEDSKNCAYSLALMKDKTQSPAALFWDAGIFLGLVPVMMFQNLKYVIRKRAFQHLKITPLYVMSALFGWVRGRAEYRLT